MKIVIPVAGQGVRLKPHTYTLPKVLIEVAGKPILGHILDEIKKIGLKDLILVIGNMGEKIQNYVKENYKFNVKYVYQKERLGLGHAIYLAGEFFDNKPVLIILGDTLFKANLKNVINKKYTAIGIKPVDNPRRFGVVCVEDGFVKELIEKSSSPPSNLAIVGIYFIRNSKLLKKCLKKIISTDKKTAGEYQLTDALQEMIQENEKIKIFEVDKWYDCGKPETLLSTNRCLLADKKTDDFYEYKSSIIIKPVFISKTANIENSIIGPYVSVADEVMIKNSIVKNSIINKSAHCENVLLNNSIIGSNAHIIGRFDRINLGDSSIIDLGYKEEILEEKEDYNANISI